MRQSILNINVSGFESCTATLSKEVNLLRWLTSDKYRGRVEEIRKLQDETLQKDIKMTLPAITPSGIFSYRSEEHLTTHSGFLAFDIDLSDNTHIANFDDLKTQVSHVVNVAYCGLSVRGKGYWGLVPIPKSTPIEHKQRFSALANDFKRFGINLDPSGCDVCRLRIYSWDAEAYFNHNAKLYTKIFKPQKKSSTRPAYSNTREKIEGIIEKIKQDKTDITEDYQIWLKIGCAFADEFGGGGRDYFHSVSQFHPDYSPDKTDRMFDDILKHGYDKVSIGWFFNLLKDYGISLKTELKPLPKVEKKPISDISRGDVPKGNVCKTLSDIGITRKPKLQKGGWDAAIMELEQFFTQINIPNEPIRLNGLTLITDPAKMINAELSIIKYQNGNKRYLPDLERLRELKRILSN